MALFVASLALLVAAALLGRGWYAHEREEEQRARQALCDLLGRRVEPGRDEHPAIVAAALSLHGGELSNTECVDQEGGPRTCAIIEALHDSARLLATALTIPVEAPREPVGPRSGPPAPPDQRRLTAALERAERVLRSAGVERSAAQWEGWRERSLAGLSEPIDVRPCPEVYPTIATSPSSRHHEQHFGAAGCDAQPERWHAKLLVPSRLRLSSDASGVEAVDARRGAPRGRPALRRAAPERAGPPVAPYAPRVLEAIIASRVVNALIEPVAEGGAVGPGASSLTRLVQAYFISPDGLLRIWSDDATDVPYERLGPVRMWSESGLGYFSPLLTSSSAATAPTAPYIDAGAYGFVQTQCTAIRGGRGGLRGAFCTDRTLPLQSQPTPSTHDRPYSAVRASVQLGADGGARVTIPAGEPCESLVEHSFGRSPPAGGACGWLTRKVQSGLSSPDSEGLSRVIKVDIEGSSVFVVPLERLRENGRHSYRVLLISPRLRDTDSWGMLGFLSILFLAAVLAAIAVARTRAESKRRQEDAVLQNLHVGVIAGVQQEDGQTVIESANDRAEELLGVPLPAFGAAETGQEHFRDLIDEDSMMAAGLDPRSLEWEPGKKMVLADVAKLRFAGRSSAYFVRAKRRASAHPPSSNVPSPAEEPSTPEQDQEPAWILVRASPFLQHARREGPLALVRTFAVLEPVSSATARTLDTQVSRERGQSPSPELN